MAYTLANLQTDIRNYTEVGSNVLSDTVLERIIKSAGPLENKSILEIGGGSGNLTKHLLKAKPKKILSWSNSLYHQYLY